MRGMSHRHGRDFKSQIGDEISQRLTTVGREQKLQAAGEKKTVVNVTNVPDDSCGRSWKHGRKVMVAGGVLRAEKEQRSPLASYFLHPVSYWGSRWCLHRAFQFCRTLSPHMQHSCQTEAGSICTSLQGSTAQQTDRSHWHHFI